MADMSKQNLEMQLAHNIKEHFAELSFCGCMNGKEIIDVLDVNVSLERDYDGKNRYKFEGSASIFVKIGKDKAGEYYKIGGVVFIEEGDESPLVEVEGSITVRSLSGI